MKCWIILSLSLCALYQSVAAGNGYVYQAPAKRMETPPAGVQNDFDLDEFITSQKQSIFSSFAQKKPGFKQCADCTCGIQNGNRIVGGTQVRSNKYPWTAQLLMGKKRLFCGGTLINDRYVVTAAHCIHKMNWQGMSVRLLQYDRNSFSDAGITRKVSKAIVHENYNPTTIVNDIALLRLDSPIPLTEPLRPACLPSPTQNFDLKQGTVAGWGLTKEFGSVATILHEVTVPIITNVQCMGTQYKNMITEFMLCAGVVSTGGKDACQGDSGGPLTVMLGNSYNLAGVVSYGYGCAKPNAPGVYTRVSKYINWISKNTADACYCKK